MSDSTGQMILDFSPATRHSHPETSRLAEEKITSTGSRQTHCRIILNVLLRCDGLTTAEIARRTFLTEEQVHKRMHDLVGNYYIKRGHERVCKVKRSLCSTWWIL